MPAAMLAHERAQFAIYGLMLLTPLRDPRATVTAGKRGEVDALTVEHPSAPKTTLLFENDGRLVGALNQVSDPEDAAKPAIGQMFLFEGELVSNGVRWPRIISIVQNDQPYFDLRLSTFEARP
jgi:hypothetical protein